MGRIFSFRTNFSSGELSPRMSSRIDMAAYENGAKQVRNLRQLVQGGLTRRPGTKHIAKLSHTNAVQTASFLFNIDQAYFFIFSAGRADIFHRDGTACTALTSCPWTASEVGSLYTTQSGDTMIVSHPDMPMQKIKRTGATTFSLEAYAFEEDTSGAPLRQPYHKFSEAAVTLSFSATSGTITVTASAALFTSDHINTICRVNYGTGSAAAYKEFKITAVASGTSATALVRETLGGTAAQADFEEQVFSAVRGHARVCLFSDQRLHFFGSRDLPNFHFASKVSAFFNFDAGEAEPADSIQEQISEDQVLQIVGAASLNHLAIFTESMEVFIPKSDEASISPADIANKKQTRYGSGKIPPREFDGGVIFLTRNKATVREFLFDDIQQSFRADALNYLSEHLLVNPVYFDVSLGEAGQAEQYAYFINSDGTVAVFISERQNKIAGWSQWSTTGSFKSISNVADRMYLVSERNLGSGNELFVEYFDLSLDMDSVVSLTNGSPQSTWTGLSHFANQTVHVTTDRSLFLGTFTVDGSGNLDLGSSNTVNNIQVGLNFTSTVETLPALVSLRTGPGVGDPVRLVRCIVDVVETFNIIVDGSRLLIRNTTDDLSSAPVSKTGHEEFYLLGWKGADQATVTVTQDVPLPLTLNGVFVEVEI